VDVYLMVKTVRMGPPAGMPVGHPAVDLAIFEAAQ